MMKKRISVGLKRRGRVVAGVWLFLLVVAGAAISCSEPEPAEPEPGADAADAIPAGVPAVDTVVAMGNIVEQTTAADGSVVTTTSDGVVTVLRADGSTTVTAPDGTSSTTHADGTVVTTAPDGTTTTRGPDGTQVTQSPDGTVTTRQLDGTTTVQAPDGTQTVLNADGTPRTPSDAVRAVAGAGATAAGSSAGGASGSEQAGAPTGGVATAGAGVGPTEDGPIWINESGHVDAARNEFAIEGDWYSFNDGVTSEQSGNPYSAGKYCLSGQALGEDGGSWGAGMGLDLNNAGAKAPYLFAGKVSGFRITFSGDIPSEARVHLVVDPDIDVNPFIPLEMGEKVYWIDEAQVPFSWGVDNAGQRVEDVLYSVQVLVPGDAEPGPIALCIEDFEPVFEPDRAVALGGSTFINADGFVQGDENDLGIEGPVYVISDGRSATTTGVPYAEGKYCVAGEFSGGANDWGAGIAFDLNKPPGDERAAYDATQLAALRLGLSGYTPGRVRIQFVVNEPQDGSQPWLVGQLNSTAVYPLAWAQVPTSWDVAEAGREIDTEVYSVQVYLEGDQAGPFEVCVEDFAPLAAAEVVYDAAPNGSGFLTIDQDRLQAEYELWKSRHFHDCGDGSACVPRDDGDCISEGVAYGMLLAAAFEDRDAFDKLWQYYKKNKNQNGVMNWQTAACGGVLSDGSATDGELDAAMALLQAACHWGDVYASDAGTLLQAVEASEVATCNEGKVLKPGDDFGGCNETNPSYVAPAYYKRFAEFRGQAVWNELTDDGYVLLATAQSRKNGLLPDWCDSAGTPQGGSRGEYGPDASRVPWRMATDYLWHGDSRAASVLDGVAAYLEQSGGVERSFTPNSNYRGGAAFAAQQLDAQDAQRSADAWLLTSVDDNSYFPGTLRPIYMLLAAGQFSPGCF